MFLTECPILPLPETVTRMKPTVLKAEKISQSSSSAFVRVKAASPGSSLFVVCLASAVRLTMNASSILWGIHEGAFRTKL